MSLQAVSQATSNLVHWGIRQTGSELLSRVYSAAERALGQTVASFGALASVGAAIYFTATWLFSTSEAPAAPHEPRRRRATLEEMNETLKEMVEGTSLDKVAVTEADLLDTHFNKIFEQVYVGDAHTVEQLLGLTAKQLIGVQVGAPEVDFATIISVAGRGDATQNYPYPQVAGKRHLSHVFDDSAAGLKQLLSCKGGIFRSIDAARREKKPVLIHCAAGQSRSVGTLILYLVERLGVTFEQAYYFVQHERHNAADFEGERPSGFLRDLKVHCDARAAAPLEDDEDRDGMGEGPLMLRTLTPDATGGAVPAAAGASEAASGVDQYSLPFRLRAGRTEHITFNSDDTRTVEQVLRTALPELTVGKTQLRVPGVDVTSRVCDCDFTKLSSLSCLNLIIR